MNDIEDRVRRALRTDVPGIEADPLLADIHTGVGRRKRRRTAAVIAASTLVVVGAVGVATQFGGGGTGTEQPPTTQLPTPSEPTLRPGSARGTVDVSVASPEAVFRLTANDGCVACDTVWRRDVSADGGWARLHDFQARDAAALPFGPVTHLLMAADAQDGWAWRDRLFSTHDGGRTWTEVTKGPGRRTTEFGHGVAITEATSSAWSLLRTAEGTELWRTDLGSDDWVRTDAPDMPSVSGMSTLSDYVLLETSDEGLSGPRLQYFRLGDGLPWGEVMNPCEGENQVYPAFSVAFILCGTGEGATVYRLVGVDHPTAGEQVFRWYEFGQSSGAVTAVHAIDDRRLLIVGRGGKATLLTDDGDTVDALASSTAVDLGLAADEETFEGSSSGDLSMLTTFDDQLVGSMIQSTDGGRTWHGVE